MVPLFLLYCLTNCVLQSAALTGDADQNHGDYMSTADGLNLINVDTVRNLITQEVDKRWSKIVSSLQDRLVAQDRRIRYLETRDKRRQMDINRLVEKVLKLETTCDNALAQSNDLVAEQEETGQTYQGNVITQKKAQQNVHSRNGIVQREILENEDFGIRGSFQDFRRHAVRPNISQVAFTAYLDNQIRNMGKGHTIHMNKVLLNDGNGYNNYTGTFIPPVSGVYMFTYNMASYGHDTSVRLVINGKEVVGAIDSDTGTYNMAGNTAVVSVQAGQSIWLEEDRYNGGLLEGDEAYRYCTFSGVLLYIYEGTL